MIVIAYGGGTNSTAMLVGMMERGIKPDLILFADTGGEKPHTYQHICKVNNWLLANDWPQIVTVKKVYRDGSVADLYSHSINKKELPALAYGFKTCSQKFKFEPIDKYCNNNSQCLKVWKSAGKVQRWIGIDSGEDHRATGTPKRHAKKWDWFFPLLEWGWDRDDCIAAIERAGLPKPGKSACYFCPATKKAEIRQLAEHYPELAEKALEMERNAELTHIKGLGRSFAWADFLKQPDMFNSYGKDWDSDDMPCGCFDGD